MSKDLRFILKFLAVIAVFIYGFITAQTKIFPYSLLAPTVSAYGGLYNAYFHVDDMNKDWRWYEDDGLPKGMDYLDKAQVEHDYIAYTSTADTTAYLLSYKGEEIHKWHLDVEALWPDQKHLNTMRKVPFDYFTLRDLHVFPDGRIVVIVSLYGSTPWGAGLVMMDKDSNVLWAKDGNYYNDLHVDQAGNIYALRHDIIQTSDAGHFDEAVHFMPPYLQDNVVKLDQQGNIMAEYPVVDMLRQSPYKNIMMYVHDDGKGDYTHTNSIEVVEDTMSVPSFLKSGDIMVNIRNIDVLAAIDPVQNKVTWAARTPTKMPHDINVLPNGHFILYDNQGHLGAEEGYSRVIELDPETFEVVWSYAGTAAKPLESKFWGFQQRLANGNTLTTVPNKGRLLEVTQDGELVMDYYLSQRHEIDGVMHHPVLTSAVKISENALNFIQPEGAP